MILVTRFKTNNNLKYTMVGEPSGENNEKQFQIDLDDFLSSLEAIHKGQFFLDRNLRLTRFSNGSFEAYLFTYINTYDSAFGSKEKGKLTRFFDATKKIVLNNISTGKPYIDDYIDSDPLDYNQKKRFQNFLRSKYPDYIPTKFEKPSKTKNTEPAFQSQIADARQEVKPILDIESEEPQFPELQAKIDRAIESYSDLTNTHKESYRGFGISKLSLFIAFVIDMEGMGSSHKLTTENHDSRLGSNVLPSEAQPIIDYVNKTNKQFSKLPEEAKTLILNNFPREKDSLYFDSLGSYLIERQRIFDEYNNFSDTIPEDQESNDIATFPELVKFKLDILDLDFENYKIYHPSHFKKYTNLDTLDAALHVSYFGAICANEYNSQNGYQFKDKLDQAYFYEMMPIPNGKLVSRINENFRLETIETKEFLNDFYSKFLPGYNSETVTSDQAPKPNTPNAFAQSVLDGLSQYSQEGRNYVWETYPKAIRNSSSNRGRSQLMQVLEADVRLNDFLVPADVKVEQIPFAEKISFAENFYRESRVNPMFEILNKRVSTELQFKSMVLLLDDFLDFFKFFSEEKPSDTSQQRIDNFIKKINITYEGLMPGEQKLIYNAFPDRELTPKTPETKTRTLDLKNYAKDLEAIKKEYSGENYKNYYELMWSFYKSKLNNIVVFYENCGTSTEALFIFTFVESLANSYDNKIQNNELLSIDKSIEKTQDAVKKFTPEEVKKFDLQYKEYLGENYRTITELKEIENKKLLQEFVDSQYTEYNTEGRGLILAEIEISPTISLKKLIKGIEDANKRVGNNKVLIKTMLRALDPIISSIQYLDKYKILKVQDSDLTLLDNENAGGNNNPPPNRPKTSESNEDNSFDERFILLLEFINNNFGEQRDELITKLLTYCFTSDGVEFLKDFAVHEVFDDYGIIGAKEQVDAALELLGDVVDTQDKKEIIGELITSLEENYNSQKPIENQPKIPEQNSEPRERKLIDGINDIPEDEWQDTVSSAQEISDDGEFEVDLSGVDLVLQLIAASVIFKKRYQELVELKRNSGVTDEYRNKRQELIDDVGDVSNETRTIIYRRRIKFGSNNEIEEGSTNYKVTDLQKRLWGSKTASEQTQTGNKSKQPKNSTLHINADGKVETTKDTSEYFNFLENLVINLDIKAERLNFLEDNASVFATDKGLAVIVEANKPLQVIYDPTLNIAFYKFLFEDSFAGKINSQQLQEYCYFKNFKYLVKHLKDSTDKNGNSTDEVWKSRIQELIKEPENFIEWSINLDKNDYDPVTIVELRKNGLSFEQITSLYQLMQDYRSQSAIELPIEDGKFKVKTLDELSKNLKFKGESESKNEQKNIALGKIIEALERNSDLITNPFVSDYLESLIGWFDFIDRLSPYYDKYIVRISNSPGLGEFKELSQRLKNLNQTIGNKQNYSNEKKLVVQFIDTIETSFKSAYRTYLNIALQNLKTKK
jgi:hypothetical protein